jgi:hypothetical protein
LGFFKPDHRLRIFICMLFLRRKKSEGTPGRRRGPGLTGGDGGGLPGEAPKWQKPTLHHLAGPVCPLLSAILLWDNCKTSPVLDVNVENGSILDCPNA